MNESETNSLACSQCDVWERKYRKSEREKARYQQEYETQEQEMIALETASNELLIAYKHAQQRIKWLEETMELQQQEYLQAIREAQDDSIRNRKDVTKDVSIDYKQNVQNVQEQSSSGSSSIYDTKKDTNNQSVQTELQTQPFHRDEQLHTSDRINLSTTGIHHRRSVYDEKEYHDVCTQTEQTQSSIQSSIQSPIQSDEKQSSIGSKSISISKNRIVLPHNDVHHTRALQLSKMIHRGRADFQVCAGIDSIEMEIKWNIAPVVQPFTHRIQFKPPKEEFQKWSLLLKQKMYEYIREHLQHIVEPYFTLM